MAEADWITRAFEGARRRVAELPWHASMITTRPPVSGRRINRVNESDLPWFERKISED